MSGPDTVFFLSDYGLRDEFVGVVHAVLQRLAPQAKVIDLSHQVPPFDVRAGGAALARTIPQLGGGVVLAVVDPGVGGGRDALIVETGREVGDPGGPLWLVGPDNGLLVPGAGAAGGMRRVTALVLPNGADRYESVARSVTFDGRDVLAPAVAALCNGVRPDELGVEIAIDAIARLPLPVVELGRLPDRTWCLRAEVTWIDRFGNIQLAASAASYPDLPDLLAVTIEPLGADSVADPAPNALTVRHVRTFSELADDEVGLLCDANGHLALVVAQGSAASRLGASAGDLVHLVY